MSTLGNTILRHAVRPGAYFDSIVLMQLQVALASQPGIEDCAAVMVTDANRAILAASAMLPTGLDAGTDDLVVVVSAEDEEAGDQALARVDEVLARRASEADGDDLPPPLSVRQACRRQPGATWAAVSVPGRWAARVAHQALDHDLDVFLYSDNVSVEDEIALKRRAAALGRLVLGPDCGTAMLGGIGFGFANRVRAGAIGLVGASGTGIQMIASRVHELGAGISHAIGIGGRDLSEQVGGSAAFRALGLLAADDRTRVVVLVSKPPAPSVTRALVRAALSLPKPVVIAFLGTAPPIAAVGNLRFAPGLEQAAALAVEALGDEACRRPTNPGGHLRALFAGGTLAFETLAQLRFFLPLHSNLAFGDVRQLADPAVSVGHTVLDMGDDALTVGRLHPMIDPDLRLRRLREEARDASVGTILLDVVLGAGAEADPAERLAPVIAEIKQARPALEIRVVVVGTDLDPQQRDDQVARLEAAGARVSNGLAEALEGVVARTVVSEPPPESAGRGLEQPSVVNVGLESFHHSFVEQDAESIHVAWRPPAGGDARLVALLDSMNHPRGGASRELAR